MDEEKRVVLDKEVKQQKEERLISKIKHLTWMDYVVMEK